MHMNSAPHLLPEDRPEFERALDEALHAKRHTLAPAPYAAAARDAAAPEEGARARPDPDAGQGGGAGEQPGTLSSEQLRAMALSAVTAIAACAAAEYERFVELRTELRDPANAPSSAGPSGYGPAGADAGRDDAGRAHGADEGSGDGADGGTEPGGEAEGGAGTGVPGRGAAGPGGPGAGLVAMASVLVPVLAGTAAVIFLAVGYLLHLLLTPEPTVAAPMRGAGWVFALLAVLGTAAAMVGLWRTALRNGSPRKGAARGGFAARRAVRDGGDGAVRADAAQDLAARVDAARAAWREALLERGIEPFLREALAEPRGMRRTSSTQASAPEPAPSANEPERHPRLGYSGPDLPHFSGSAPTGASEEPSVRPRFSSPDFSSPDYGGPEHQPE